MRIKFIPPDPRAGSIAQMDSFRGQQLVDSKAAVKVKEDGSENEAVAIAQVPPEASTVVVPETTTPPLAPLVPVQKASFGLNVEQIRKALLDKGIAIPDGVSRKVELAALLDGDAK